MDADSVREYTREEAITLGRRAICEDGEGHHIQRCSTLRNANGSLVCADYTCANCDVIVTLTYPEKP
jgi:hypothetical protein